MGESLVKDGFRNLELNLTNFGENFGEAEFAAVHSVQKII